MKKDSHLEDARAADEARRAAGGPRSARHAVVWGALHRYLVAQQHGELRSPSPPGRGRRGPG